MLLTIDVGNTNMEFGIFEGSQLLGTFRLRTNGEVTSDELGLLAVGYFQRFGMDPQAVENVVIASVVPQVMYSLNSACIKYFGKRPLVVGEEITAHLDYAPMIKERLGADRVVACVAGIEKYGAPLIVMDFGTATTIDAISAERVYLGGTISTGLQGTMDTLTSRAAMLPRVEVAMPERVIGINTVMQIQAGVVAGYVGSMEYLLARIKKEMEEPNVRVVATGGLSRLIAENTSMIDVRDSQLILDGLRILYDQYQNN